MTGITREEIERMSKTIRLYSNPLWEADLARLLAAAERSLTEQFRIDEAVAKERERISAILTDDAVCCNRPLMREVYAYDEHGNATAVIGEVIDGCCGCPEQRDPAEIVERIKVALSPTPTTEEGA